MWGLEYETLSDTDSGSGSFAGVFYTKPDVEHPFMIVCFKGSPLTNVGKVGRLFSVSRGEADFALRARVGSSSRT